MARRKGNYFVLENAFNRRGSSERMLMTVALLSVIGLGVKSACIDTGLEKWNAINARIESTEKERLGYKAELEQVIKTHQIDRLKPLRIKKQDLSKDIKDIDSEIKKILDGSVSADEMRYLLVSILKSNPSLKIISLSNIDDVVLDSRIINKDLKDKQGKNQDSDKNQDQTIPEFLFYKHGMHIKFEGEYESTTQYLKQLEGLKYKLIWENIEYTVSKYPRAVVDLTVVTINDKKGWVGV